MKRGSALHTYNLIITSSTENIKYRVQEALLIKERKLFADPSTRRISTTCNQ
jgi:hypothetical protein